MSKESKRLRSRAADQLRQSRRSELAGNKAVHARRAASLKAMAENEEWLEGEKPRPGKPRSAKG